jgi:hypothetical protein
LSPRISRERLDSIAQRVLEALQKTPGATVLNPEGVKSVVRAMIVNNLAEEDALEKEVIEMLRAHGQKIFEANADFQKMIMEGKKVLAKKKGFTL